MPDELVRASERDVASLRAAGLAVDAISRSGEWDRETTFRRAVVRGAAGAVVEIHWAADSAFRFFPIERDARLGWRLHLFDAATNNALTLAARTETRDYVDIVEVARTYPLAAICARIVDDQNFVGNASLRQKGMQTGGKVAGLIMSADNDADTQRHRCALGTALIFLPRPYVPGKKRRRGIPTRIHTASAIDVTIQWLKCNDNVKCPGCRSIR